MRESLESWMLWAELCVPQTHMSGFWLPAPEGVTLFRDETLTEVIIATRPLRWALTQFDWSPHKTGKLTQRDTRDVPAEKRPSEGAVQ